MQNLLHFQQNKKLPAMTRILCDGHWSLGCLYMNVKQQRRAGAATEPEEPWPVRPFTIDIIDGLPGICRVASPKKKQSGQTSPGCVCWEAREERRRNIPCRAMAAQEEHRVESQDSGLLCSAGRCEPRRTPGQTQDSVGVADAEGEGQKAVRRPLLREYHVHRLDPEQTSPETRDAARLLCINSCPGRRRRAHNGCSTNPDAAGAS